MGKKLLWILVTTAILAPSSAMAQTANSETQAGTEQSGVADSAAQATSAESDAAPAKVANEQTGTNAAGVNNETAVSATSTGSAPVQEQPKAEQMGGDAVNSDQAVESTKNDGVEEKQAEAVSSEVTADKTPSQTTVAGAAPNDVHEQPTKERETAVLPETVKAQKDDREARKEAMRNLSKRYPADGNGETASETTAQKAESSSEPVRARVIPAAQKTSERMPHFEHHGYFRTRLTAFGNYDLNTRGTSPVPAPLNSNHRGNASQDNIDTDDSDTLLGGNLRFRYSPTIHISETIRIAGSFDILDNLVMGTTPNGLRTNWGSEAFFTFNGAEPVNGDTIGKNAVTVKALYGEANTILGTFRAGRVPAHWGLGIVYNDGGVYKRDEQIIHGQGWKCLDCDSSDAVDRIEWRIRDPFFDALYLDFSWDFINSGLASYNLQQDSLGQAFDLADSDDVLQFTLSIFDRPISQQEVDERYRSLYETRDWTVDWGVLFSYREQSIAAEPDTSQTNDGAASTYDMFKKNAKAYAVDLWGRFFIPFPKDVLLRLEAEFVGVFGSISKDTGNDGKSRDILQIGFAFEGEVKWRDLTTGLKTGVAWADNMVYSGHSLIESLDVVPMGSILRFDPNYTVDTIMFRELMGGINNAWYLNIYGEYKFPIQMPQTTMALGARLDLTTSGAIETDATPGNSWWYGFEGNVKLFYDESDRFRFEIGAGIFVPGMAWENVDYPILPAQSVYENSNSETYDPDIAWNVLANLYFMF